ncbi:hypothetical protein [Cellulomonas sp. P5_C6]
MSVHGPGAIFALCVRCFAVLVAVNVTVVVGFQLITDPTTLTGSGVGFLAYVAMVAAVPIGVVGFPAGLLIARLLRRTRSELVHVAVFALVGAVLSVAICVAVGLVDPADPQALLAAAEGAVGAGGARWWSGWATARRARRPATPTAEQVEDAQLDGAERA